MYGVCLQNAAERWNMNTEIWVITHKKYNEIPDDLYKTIHVGRAISSDLGYTGDDTGDNISLRTGITVNLPECTGYGRITSVILLEPAIIEDFS